MNTFENHKGKKLMLQPGFFSVSLMIIILHILMKKKTKNYLKKFSLIHCLWLWPPLQLPDEPGCIYFNIQGKVVWLTVKFLSTQTKRLISYLENFQYSRKTIFSWFLHILLHVSPTGVKLSIFFTPTKTSNTLRKRC